MSSRQEGEDDAYIDELMKNDATMLDQENKLYEARIESKEMRKQFEEIYERLENSDGELSEW